VKRCNHRLKNHVILESLHSAGQKVTGFPIRWCATVLLAGTIAVNQISVVHQAIWNVWFVLLQNRIVKEVVPQNLIRFMKIVSESTVCDRFGS